MVVNHQFGEEGIVLAERTLAGSDGGLLHNTAPQPPLLIYLETLIKVDAFVWYSVCWSIGTVRICVLIFPQVFAEEWFIVENRWGLDNPRLHIKSLSNSQHPNFRKPCTTMNTNAAFVILQYSNKINSERSEPLET